MDETDVSHGIARLLAWIIPRHRDPAFLDYLALTFSRSIAEYPRFEALCLAEAEYGEVRTGVIGGMMKRWWLADQDGFRAVHWRELPRFVDDFYDAERTGRTFYRSPLVKFLREGMQVTFGEAFGPELACRKLGRVQQLGNTIAIVDVRLVWNWMSLGSNLPLPPVTQALNIDERRVAEAGAAADWPRE